MLRNGVIAACAALVAAAGAIDARAERPDVVCVYYPHWHRYPKGDEWFGADRWQNGEWTFVKDAVRRFPGHKQPLVPTTGYLDGANPEDVAKEIALASDAGIDVFLYDYYWYGGKVTQEESIEKGFLGAKNRNRMKFALMWCYHERRDQFRPKLGEQRRILMPLAHTKEEFLGLIRYSVDHYFCKPEYWRKDGKLFFSIYDAHYFCAKRGNDAARIKAEIDEARAIVRAAGLGEMHINAQGAGPKLADFMADCGFDSLTDYNTSPYQMPAEMTSAMRAKGEWEIDYRASFPTVRKRWREMSAKKLPYIPNVTTGWDSTPRCRPDEPYPWRALDYPYTMSFTNNTPEAFREILAEAKAHAESDPKKPGAVYINGWNEYTEGSFLIPNNFYADGALRAIESVFGRRTRAEEASAAATVPDACVGPRLQDVRLGGAPGKKLDAFIQARMTSAFAQREIFGEARRAFERRDDDEALSVGGRRVGGWWRGEFWGKLMLGTARVADYLQDESLLRFVREESRRMVDLADEDGYLGSYGDKENVCISPADSPAVRKSYGWNSNWNIWNRKYVMWGLLAAYRSTGDRTLLASVERQMDQLIDMLHRMKTPLYACGQPEKVGLPPMSILKPLLLLYEETGNRRYLDFAEETIRDWDRDDGACPNFFRNAGRSAQISTWYPKCTQWAKTYEMLSCLDGILEHYRVTGSRRSLDIVRSIRDNIAESEANGIGGVGYCDQLNRAATRMNAISEVCDAVHWIRLNLDLYMITGEDRYLDAMETCYLNNFLAGVFRDGSWCAFAVRGCTRHAVGRQCGYAYNHCCVNNAARTWMDMASAGVTKDSNGTFHVNFFEDSTVRFGDLLFEISGNYPVGSNVTVRISGGDPKVVFRKPGWCPKMDVVHDGSVYRLTFDMNPRIVNRALAHDVEGDDRKNWLYTRYMVACGSDGAVSRGYRTTPAAEVMWGPLVLARSLHAGALPGGLAGESSVNGMGYSIKAEPITSSCTWGAWNLELSGPGGDIRRFKVCDYQSAGDCPYADGANVFSIWF